MENFISQIINQETTFSTKFSDFKKIINLIKKINPNYIDIKNSFFGFEDDKCSFFLIKLNSNNDQNIPIVVELDFIFNTCLYTLGKNNEIIATFGNEIIDLEIVYNTLKEYMTTQYTEFSFYNKNKKLVKGYYIASKDKQKKMWYKWSFSFYIKLTLKKIIYKSWI